MIFFDSFFHKISWLPHFFKKTISPFFSKNVNIWLNRYLLWGLPLIKYLDNFQSIVPNFDTTLTIFGTFLKILVTQVASWYKLLCIC
jgi:hypothetical protein